MKITTIGLIFSLIWLFGCGGEPGDQSSTTPSLDEDELRRVTALIDPAPETYQEDQVNKLVQYALEHDWPVRKSASGLLYWIRKKGNEVSAGTDDSVLVRYKGTLLDGSVFDQSPASGEPVTFKIAQVIPAWKEALSMIGEEGQIVILAHSDLGYKGQRIGRVIPPYSPLIFEIELIDVNQSQ